MESFKNMSPHDVAQVLTAIKQHAQEKGWIPQTQLTQIDVMLTQLYRAHGKYLSLATASKPKKKKEIPNAIQ